MEDTTPLGFNSIRQSSRGSPSFLRPTPGFEKDPRRGNTAIKSKRAIFFKRLLPRLELERERDGIDLSKVQLTRHELTHLSKRALSLSKK
jgi:hypothetical protein